MAAELSGGWSLLPLPRQDHATAATAARAATPAAAPTSPTALRGGGCSRRDESAAGAAAAR